MGHFTVDKVIWTLQHIRIEFNLRPVHVEFVGIKVASEKVSLQALQFWPINHHSSYAIYSSLIIALGVLMLTWLPLFNHKTTKTTCPCMSAYQNKLY
jgi:hypothetical protein